MQQNEHADGPGDSQAPYPGSHQMPRWEVGELPEAPRFSWKNLPQFIGPGLMMGGAAIGGGEWLLGPVVTAKLGAGMLWLATLSILGQVLYNIEVSRYALYTGEPIFNGKFRTLPGPMFWLGAYIIFDIGSLFPYLASNAATPIAMLYLRDIPNPDKFPWHETLLRGISIAVFLFGMLPLLFGGKIMNSLKLIMTFKAAFILGFLTLLGMFYAHWESWWEIATGFFKFGNMPTEGNNVENVFSLLWHGKPLPLLDLTMIAYLSGMVAIAGQGGLTNAPISNYTRDQGWGMGAQVGAIPSLVGGIDVQLSHVGKVFLVSKQALERWKGWYRHILRDQLMVWMPACFIGLGLPSLLSVEFLQRGADLPNSWATAGMTAAKVQERVGGQLGNVSWYMIVFCGVLVLVPTVTGTADGFIRRWVDVFWSASARLRKLGPEKIKQVYVCALLFYVSTGVVFLLIGNPIMLIKVATAILNIALGASCWHVVAVNSILLPKEIRPNYFIRAGLIAAGIFFWSMAIPSICMTYKELTAPPKPKSVQPQPNQAPADPGKKSAAVVWPSQSESRKVAVLDIFRTVERLSTLATVPLAACPADKTCLASGRPPAAA